MSPQRWDALIASYQAFLPRADDDAKLVIWDEITRLRELQAEEVKEAA